MKTYRNTYKSRIECHDTFEGSSIEEFLRKAIAGKEPIKAGAKVTYNDRKDGVLAQHDIRQDRFEIAMMATDRIHASEAAKRQMIDFPKDENGNTIPAGEA